MNISQSLIKWYNSKKRDLPWRKTNDPYRIWLSEIILQQTRVVQGLKYYNRFIESFPKIENLASASEEEVLKLWQGLGYYSRARNLHFTANEIVQKYEGKFPDNFKDLKKLKGIGEYTASAIASFCFNLPYPVIDGNVIRVITRLFNIQNPIEEANTKSEIKEALHEIFDKNNPGTFNQAIMEFGALQCTPKSPNCLDCSLNNFCFAYSNDTVNEIPRKIKKIKTRERFFNYLVIIRNNHLFLNKRSNEDIWKNLYEFPLLETDIQQELSEILINSDILLKNCEFEISKESKIIKHVLSHQILYIRFITLKLKNTSDFLEENYIKISIDKLRKHPVPIVISNYIEKELLNNN
jgi:A/G-specific adenine glycosylase